MESSFTDAEKRFVLAEMIKVSNMDVDILVDFVKHHDIRFEWLEMQLPGGRNMNQCIRAAEVMFGVQLRPPPVPPPKRKSFGDISEHIPKRQALMSPTESHPYPAPRGFGMHSISASHPQIQPQPPPPPPPPPQPQPQPQPQLQPINIQPRPSPNGPNGPNGYAASPSASSPTVSVTTPTVAGRRRGRPSKADKEAWARANTSQSTGYPPIVPAPIAPLPLQATAQPNYGSGPSAPPAYQISSGSALESKSRRKGRPSALEKQQRSESVPRTVQGGTGSDSGEQQTGGERHEHPDVRESPRQQEQRQSSNQGPTPVEPPFQPQSSGAHQPIRSPYPPFTTGGAHAHMGPISPAMEQARKEGHPPATKA